MLQQLEPLRTGKWIGDGLGDSPMMPAGHEVGTFCRADSLRCLFRSVTELKGFEPLFGIANLLLDIKMGWKKLRGK